MIWLRGEPGEFGAAQRAPEPDQQQCPVPEPGQVRFGGPGAGLPGLGGGAGVEHVEQLRRSQLGRPARVGAVGAPDAALGSVPVETLSDDAINALLAAFPDRQT